MAFWAIAAPLIASAIGAGASAYGTSQSNATSENLNDENRQFQMEMSSSAYQRATTDLRNAGLNPILAANGGASAPSGGVPDVRNPFEGLAETVASSARSSGELLLNKEKAKTEKSQRDLNDAVSRRIVVESANSALDAQRKSLLIQKEIKTGASERGDWGKVSGFIKSLNPFSNMFK